MFKSDLQNVGGTVRAHRMMYLRRDTLCCLSALERVHETYLGNLGCKFLLEFTTSHCDSLLSVALNGGETVTLGLKGILHHFVYLALLVEKILHLSVHIDFFSLLTNY